VLQVRKKDCGCMYALKVLDKVVLASRSRRWQLHCSRERECLIACDHPYIVRILYAFQTPQYLYMVQEHVPNHTLAGYLEAHDGRPVAEAEVRFMVAQLALALAHMHARSILYRDLKPANVLIDEDGHLTIVDRVKELIKFKGFQVAPAELEALLLTHPAIADAAVIGVSDDEAGERPRAFVVLKPGQDASADEITAFTAEHLATYKVVHDIEFTEEIPKSASGKILRRMLRDQ